MITMLRWTVALATLLVVLSHGANLQELVVLRVRIVLADAEQRATPVSRYALLVSDNPASAEPRRLLTALDGTVEVRLRPGSYIVESDRPFGFEGKAYQWTQVVELVAGRDTLLELTAANAEVEVSSSASTTAPAAADTDVSSILSRWQDSVLALWTPTARATGFLIDARGLIATTERVVGRASTVEVQFTPNVKIAASVVVADAARDVAILRVNPSRLASMRAIPLGCTEPVAPHTGQEVVALEVPLRQQKGTTSGEITRIQSQTIYADIGLSNGGVGGPVFAADGRLVGLTSIADARVSQKIEDVLIVRVGTLCDVVASVEKQVTDGQPPAESLLPVEPLKAMPVDALQDAATRRAGNLISYQTASIDFDITFITPVLTYAAQDRPRPLGQPGRGGGGRPVTVAPALASPLLDFANWSEYVIDIPPVLLVRVTPKLAEPFWGKVARGAAMSKGIPIPPIKRFHAGFERLRAFCGDKEVAPIHPFKLERRVSESDAIYEGLYVFDPDAFSPGCGRITLELYSEKAPGKPVTHTVEPHVVAQFWQDFEPYRALK